MKFKAGDIIRFSNPNSSCYYRVKDSTDIEYLVVDFMGWTYGDQFFMPKYNDKTVWIDSRSYPCEKVSKQKEHQIKLNLAGNKI